LSSFDKYPKQFKFISESIISSVVVKKNQNKTQSKNILFEHVTLMKIRWYLFAFFYNLPAFQIFDFNYLKYLVNEYCDIKMKMEYTFEP